MSKTISLVALAAAYLHAIEHDSNGSDINGAAIIFVSSDPSIFTATVNPNDPMSVELVGVAPGAAILSVYDADQSNLHVSFDVVVSPALASALELDTATGERVESREEQAAAPAAVAEAETSADLEQAQHDAAPDGTEAEPEDPNDGTEAAS